MKRAAKRYLLPPPLLSFFIRKVPLAIALVAVVGAFLPWSMYSSGIGRVTALDPNERVQDITAPLGGFVRAWHVKEGSVLKKGDLIVELVDGDPSLVERIEREREAAESAVQASRSAMETARLNLDRQKQLFGEGLTARKEYEKAKIEVSKLSVELSKSLAVLTKAQTQVSRQATQSVVAPRDGSVLRVMAGEGNRLLKSGDPLVVFAPALTSPAVELWIPGNDMRFAVPGQSARVQLEGWPSAQIPGWPSLAIGTFPAKVKIVDYASSHLGKFRVLLVPDQEKWPSANFLRLNGSARGVISLGDTHVGWEIWRKLNDFPPLQEPIMDELDKMLHQKEGTAKPAPPMEKSGEAK
jgi:pyruvate/2-oxoglutarate dehydrogenase complex dihydrolipoamide acyltransferase (E2) component